MGYNNHLSNTLVNQDIRIHRIRVAVLTEIKVDTRGEKRIFDIMFESS